MKNSKKLSALALSLLLSSSAALPAFAIDMPAPTLSFQIPEVEIYEGEIPIIRGEDDVFIYGDAINNTIGESLSISTVRVSSNEVQIEFEIADASYMNPINADGINLLFFTQLWETLPYSVFLSDVEWTATLSSDGNMIITVDLTSLDFTINPEELVLINIHNIDFNAPLVDFDAPNTFNSIVFANEEHFLESQRFPSADPIRLEDFDTVEAFLQHLEFGFGFNHLIEDIKPLNIRYSSGDMVLELLSTVAITRPQSSGVQATTFVRVTDTGDDEIFSNFDQFGFSRGNTMTFRDIFPDNEWGLGEFTNELWATHFDEETNSAYFILRNWIPTLPDQEVGNQILLNVLFDELFTGFNMQTTLIDDLNIVELISMHQGEFTFDEQDSRGRSGGFWFGAEQDQWMQDNGFENPDEVMAHFGTLVDGDLDIEIAEGVYLTNVALTDDVAHVQITTTEPTMWGIGGGRSLDLRSSDWVLPPYTLFSNTNINPTDENDSAFRFVINYGFIIHDKADLNNLVFEIFEQFFDNQTPLGINASFVVPIVLEGAFSEATHQITVADEDFRVTNVSLDSSWISMELSYGPRLQEIFESIGFEKFSTFFDFTTLEGLFDLSVLYEDGTSVSVSPAASFFSVGGDFHFTDELTGDEFHWFSPSMLDFRFWNNDLGRTGDIVSLFINGSEIAFR